MRFSGSTMRVCGDQELSVAHAVVNQLVEVSDSELVDQQLQRVPNWEDDRARRLVGNEHALETDEPTRPLASPVGPAGLLGA
jgi:hypothetical protein